MQTCPYVMKAGKRRGQACGKRGKHEDGACSDHYKSLIDGKSGGRNLANDEVFGSIVKPDIAEVGPKVKSSVWLITINSQKDLDKMSTEQKNNFKDFGSWVFDRDRFVQYYLYDTKEPNNPAKNIKDLSIAYQYEVGDQQGRLHLHGIVKLKHVGHYKFLANNLRAFAKQALGYNIHLNAPVRSDDVGAMEEYIAKSGTVVSV